MSHHHDVARAMPAVAERYEDAALRHFNDARFLATDCRWDDAGHLIGFAAECSVKHIVQTQTKKPVPHYHFPDLTQRIRTLGGRNALNNVRKALSRYGQPTAFDDWDVAMRYAATGSVTCSQYSAWQQAAGRVMAAARIKRASP